MEWVIFHFRIIDGSFIEGTFMETFQRFEEILYFAKINRATWKRLKVVL